jgi:DNA-directed RNA polymerase sigma subunit (sigma70/sigma32)
MKEIEALLGSLTDRQREVLRLRYAVGRDYALPLSVIAQQMGISRERVHQIEHEGKVKLLSSLNKEKKAAVMKFLETCRKSGRERMKALVKTTLIPTGSKKALSRTTT